MKRQSFPRLYFLSNEELFDIFGKQEVIMKEMLAGYGKSFLQTLFEGIEDLKIDPESLMIVGFKSRHEEYIRLLQKIKTVNCGPDYWLE